MTINRILLLAALLISVFCSGWFANELWQKKLSEIQSTLAEVSAHDAAQRGDLDAAIKWSAYALALNHESAIADLQLNEFIKKRTGQITSLKDMKRTTAK